MAKPELGTKRIDPETGRKFYDLNKDPIVSPYTGKSYPRSYFEGEAEKAREPEPEEAETETEVESDGKTVSFSDVEADENDSGDKNMPDIDDSDDEDLSDDNDDDDDTFLEDDEDDDDVSDILGGGRDEDDES